MMSPRVCAICGAQFAPRSASHAYCSTACRARSKSAANMAWNAKKQGGEIVPLAEQTRTCVICGQTFTPRGHLQLICTKWECKRERNRRAKAKQRSASVCVICGQPFVRDGASVRTTCSRSCRDELSSRTQSERVTAPAPTPQRAADLGFHAMRTYCPEFPSWDCPEMLPFDCFDYGHYEPKKIKSHREITA